MPDAAEMIEFQPIRGWPNQHLVSEPVRQYLAPLAPELTIATGLRRRP